MSLGGLIRLAREREVERARRARGATVFEFATFSRGKRGNIAPHVRDYLDGKWRR